MVSRKIFRYGFALHPAQGKSVRNMPRRFVGLFLAFMISTAAYAEISFDGFTRFIFMDGQSQIPVTLVNPDDEPALVQVRLDWGDPQETRSLPMALSKPLLLIQGNSKAVVNIFYQGVGLPANQESFILLKVMRLPKKNSEENSVQIAVQHNLKLFYRPKLSGSAEEAIEKLHWSPSGSASYQTRNDSPYYLTITQVGVVDSSGALCGKAVDHVMIAPFATYELTVATCSRPIREIIYSFISDAGTASSYRSDLL